MADWEIDWPTSEQQGYVEQGFWPVIGTAASFVRQQGAACFVADSTSIRAHVGLARDIGDIDFVFPAVVDSEGLCRKAKNELAPLREETTTINHRVVFSR